MAEYKNRENKKKILFFGNKDCEQCKKILSQIKKYKLDEINKFIYIDAFADDKQNFCDEHNIDELPHVKAYNIDGELVFNEFDKINIISLLNALS